jgi:L-alanine-DL-glutamate epimerase-like enolase superfamily enzyme
MQATKARVALSAWTETIALKAPFRISGHTFEAVGIVVVELRDGPHRGRGEAAGAYYLGETAQSMLTAVEAVRGGVEAGVTREELRRLLPPGGARNALDCALWELDARRSGCPVWMLAGVGEPSCLVTTFTLSAEAPERMARDARQFPDAHALKLKLTGDDPALDAARVRAVRQARPDVWMSVDANQGLDPGRLEALTPALVEARVALLEQPFPRGREAWMADLDSPIPTAADESVLDLAELETLQGFDVINIKLDKCGGLTEGLAMAREARARGLGVMVGSMIGTSWAMGPAFVLGQLCDVVDLDGPIAIAADRPVCISYEAGRIHCPDEVWGAPPAPLPRRPRPFSRRWGE